MRLKAREGTGHPVIGGTEVRPHDDGLYHVTDPAHIDHMLASGFDDIDAPPKPAPGPGPGTPLRDAVVAALKTLGVVVPDKAGDEVLAKALGLAVADLKGAEKETADRADRKRER
jgi:hypothetical protein